MTRSEPVPQTAVAIKPDKLNALFKMIATGLVWRHWRIRPDRKTPVWSGVLDAKGEEIFNAILRVASGERTKSELLGYGDNEFVPWQIGATM